MRSTPYVNPRKGYDAHNTAVKLLVEGGVVLLAAWIAFFWLVLRRLRGLSRTQGAIRPYARMAFAFWILLVLVALTTDDPLAATALMYALMALTGAVQNPALEQLPA